MKVQQYFDFKQLFKDVLDNTLKEYKNKKQFIEENDLEAPKEIEKANKLFSFISDKERVKTLLETFENSEQQQVDFEASYIEICFDEDTSIHNEGGSYYGCYQYNFGVNTDEGIFTGLNIENHN